MIREAVKAILPERYRLSLRIFWEEHLETLAYAGKERQCPCCLTQHRIFVPHGRPLRMNARCRNRACQALERHRLLWLYLQHKRLLERPIRLLHFAPELFFRRALRAQPQIRYITADIDPRQVDVAMDITKLSLPDESVDAVLAVHVLEHIPDDFKAIAEIRRVLRRDGWAILLVPVDLEREQTFEDATIVDPALRRKHFGQEDHVRWYGRDFGQRLTSAGFDVMEDRFAFDLDEATVHRFGIVPEAVYFCRRSSKITA